ncbi:zinc finger protein 90-like [Xyrichtys novacula]|uniref:Zinc finger protein 90-like n=1 Tax=Xyrichtys novacula TaxID=13765 RepID=A0AAV1FJH2_XYRNO|nr:zinc finger protein 90-like [Xyrichtys novacula]
MTEEEAEKEENRSSAVHLNFNNVDDVEDTGGDEHLSTLSSPEETTPPGSLNVGSGQLSMKSNDHSCEICGKVYKYLSSFTKHMQQHGYLEPVHKLNPKSSKYECPDCGMRFVRKARLCGHMRIHKSRGPVNLESLKCDQCNKTFASEKSWMTHIELHKLKPFWCLSCAKGFFSEDSLEKHLLNHDLRKYSCNICSKSFRLHTQLMHHLNTHTGAKPFQCTVCGTSFSHPGNLISHRKKHVRVYAGSAGMPLGMKRSAIIAKKLEIKKQRLASASATEETDANMSELQEERDWMEESRTKNTHVNAEFGDSAQHDDMTARELLRLGKISKPQVTDALRSAMLQTQPGQQLDQTDTPDTIMFEEHKYWEWECCLCEMGFDEVAELHMHYIKHASGELPVPHDVL